MVKILILGGGFGGIRCALDLGRKLKGSAKVTLVDKNSYHLFVPSLYEVASAYGVGKDPFAMKLRRTICIPYADIFNGTDIDFVQAELSQVSLKDKQVKTKGENIIEYDHLVLALGSQTADFGIPGVGDYAYQFKNIDDAISINQKIIKLMEEFSSQGRTAPIGVLIGGAGFTGVELAAELACCIKKISKKKKIKNKSFIITLIEAGPKILPAVSEEERMVILKRLTRLGVVVMENSPIEEVAMGSVKLKSGQMLGGDMVIWTAGIKANEFLRSIDGLPLSDKGKVLVNETLEVKNLKNIFAVGDNQEFIDPQTQKPVPALAYVASAQAKIAAQNIFNSLRGKDLKKYKPYYSIWIGPIGGKFALARLWGGFTLKGFMGWAVRGLVDLKYFLSILSIKKASDLFWEDIKIFSKND